VIYQRDSYEQSRAGRNDGAHVQAASLVVGNYFVQGKASTNALRTSTLPVSCRLSGFLRKNLNTASEAWATVKLPGAQNTISPVNG
jgi:hypothetical protein